MLSVVSRRFVNKGFGGAVQCYGQKFMSGSSQSAAGTSQPKTDGDVPGLSNKCVSVPSGPVGPGAAKDKDYKNPEYFCYHENSFAEAEVEMAKFRLPAPSNKRKFVPQ